MTPAKPAGATPRPWNFISAGLYRDGEYAIVRESVRGLRPVGHNIRGNATKKYTVYTIYKIGHREFTSDSELVMAIGQRLTIGIRGESFDTLKEAKDVRIG